MGRTNAWDELSLFGVWDELSLGTNCRLGRIVAWDELSLGMNCRPTKKFKHKTIQHRKYNTFAFKFSVTSPHNLSIAQFTNAVHYEQNTKKNHII